jgi:hypothetical protein
MESGEGSMLIAAPDVDSALFRQAEPVSAQYLGRR